ncbi:hypothetical protein [Demequina aurantiaca]|uniref:hypothetical protein n=1 Tax=Demequina aurantiaca TaxID=676200 RepID=UPI000B24EBC0|nr:hypothetical protein [Demequina aurantiaca]
MDQPLPSDPMWATFRRDHPDVTLVLLPQDASHAPDESEPASAPATTTVDDAQRAFDTLQRRIALIAEMLHLNETPRGTWRGIGDDAVEPQSSVRAPASGDTPTDREMLSFRLQQLGWKPEARNESEVVWVDATAERMFVRVTIFDGMVSIRATGEEMRVGAESASALTGRDDA